MFLFFTKAHPIVMFDGDDWGLVSNFRVALPKWGGWNPSKILPETMFPIYGYISAYIVTPIVGDYINAFTVTAAIFVSFFIATYIFMVILFIENKFHLQKMPAIFLGIVFFLIHFAILKKHYDEPNYYLFYSISLTCYFYYLIPALLNAILMLLIAQINSLEDTLSKTDWKSISLLFLIYMSIFSNILDTSILCIFILVELLWQFDKKQNFSLKNVTNYLKNKWAYSAIILSWGISLLFEAYGGRAVDIRTNYSKSDFINGLSEVVTTFWSAYSNTVDIGLTIGLIIFTVISVIFIWKAKSKDDENKVLWNWVIKFSICAFIWYIYTALISTRAGAFYLIRPDVSIGLFFYLFFILIISFALYLKKYPRFMMVFPILVFALCTWTLKADKTFISSTMFNVSEYAALEFDRYMVNQLIESDRAGNLTLTLFVPKGNDIDNWPHPLYMGDNIVRTLYSHGIILHKLKVTVVADKNLNAKYNLPVK